MTDDMFERIRQRRKEALAESLRQRNEYFNPYRCDPIVELAIEPEADSVRAKITLKFSDGMVEILPHFYLAHASHMVRLCPPTVLNTFGQSQLFASAWPVSSPSN